MATDKTWHCLPNLRRLLGSGRNRGRGGKTLRTDLAKGKLTLPLLNLIEQASPAQRNKLNKRIIEQQPLDLPVLIGIAEYEGAVESALDTAADMLVDARNDLQILEPSKWRDALEEITRYLDGLLNKCRK